MRLEGKEFGQRPQYREMKMENVEGTKNSVRIQRHSGQEWVDKTSEGENKRTNKVSKDASH